MQKKSTWKVVEKKIAEELNKYFSKIGMKNVERIPILGRNGPDLTVNESGLLIDVKHRLTNPKYLQLEDKQVAQVGSSLLMVKVKDIKLLAETEKIDIILRGSRIVRGYYDHKYSHSRQKRYMPNGDVIPCNILQYPNCKYQDSVIIISKSDRSLLNERVSNSAKYGNGSGRKNKPGTKPPERNGDGEPQGGDQ